MCLGVHAFTVDVQTLDSEIYSDETAQFIFTINNDADVEKQFFIDSPDVVQWDVYTSPRSKYVLTIQPKTAEVLPIYVQPLNKLSGQYSVRVRIKDQTEGVKIEKSLAIDVQPEDTPYRQYTPSLTASIEMPTKLDPSSAEKKAIKVKIKNLIPRKLEGVTVKLSSVSGIIEEYETVDLDPLLQRTQVFLIDIDPLQAPMTDIVNAELTYVQNNQTFKWKTDSFEYEITSYSVIGETKGEDSKFLQTTGTRKFTNVGNVQNIYQVKEKVSLLKDIFYSSEPEPAVLKEDGVRYLVWELSIPSNGFAEINYKTSYRAIFYFCLAILVGIMLYFLLRSPIVVVKSAVSLNKKSEGMSEMKISIFLKNRSQRSFENIKIIDKIPNIAEVGKEFHIGTIKPIEIKRHSKSATIVKWALTHFEPFEERVITYSIVSRLTIVGGINLPPAIAKYQVGSKFRTVYSNEVGLR